MRYTIPGVDDWARRVYLNGQTRAERWRILLTGDRLRGVGRNPERPAPVHRERVRFGAWEGRPDADVSILGEERAVAHLFDARRDEYVDAARRALDFIDPGYIDRGQTVMRLARTFAHLDWSAGGAR